MPLSPSRLKSTIYNETKTELEAKFGGFKAGLLAGEQASFDDAIDKLALAIGNGDGGMTISEFTDNAEILPNTLAITPPNILDGANLPCSGDGTVTTGFGVVT